MVKVNLVELKKCLEVPQSSGPVQNALNLQFPPMRGAERRSTSLAPSRSANPMH